ncbi:MAG TPA: group I intron-associated PD-(D/E)XK endonuclease [Pyrinomonadaceae bacterium]|nr:group I intron-associated PD-(D/E)XK endonuclease [Pyrinomonadaceae bacterium]
MHTREEGISTEAKIMAALVAAGYSVFIPFGDGHKCDFVIDDEVSLRRVQCKTGRVRSGALHFCAYSKAGNGYARVSYRGLADLFAVLNPVDGKVYLIPVDEVGETEVALRLVPTLNNQKQRVRWAESYLLDF